MDWYGNPNTVWGTVNGLTEVAKNLPHLDARVAMDKAAGRVMEMAL